MIDKLGVDSLLDYNKPMSGRYRFEVRVNGDLICVAGMPKPGVLQAKLESDDWALQYESDGTAMQPAKANCELTVGGMTQDDEMLEWKHVSLLPGDVVTLRVLPPGQSEDPEQFRHDIGEWRPWADPARQAGNEG